MTGTLLNILAILLSLSAIIVSAGIAIRQAKYTRQANHVPFAAQILAELRSERFIRDEEFVISALTKECSPDLGISRLPIDVKTRVLNVASYYQTIGALCAYDILDHEMVSYMIGRRVMRAWNALEPFLRVDSENEDKGARVYSMFEDLAARSETVDRLAIAIRLGLQRIPNRPSGISDDSD